MAQSRCGALYEAPVALVPWPRDPTSYGAQHTNRDWLLKADGILDPTRWFVIQVNQFGIGLSTSPGHLIVSPAIDEEIVAL